MILFVAASGGWDVRIFKLWEGKENQFTYHFFSVLNRLSHSIMSEVLAGVIGPDNADRILLTHFQVQNLDVTIPDVGIRASLNLFFELKITQDPLPADQLAGHLNGLGPDGSLIYITPHLDRPSDTNGNPLPQEVYWVNYETIRNILVDVSGYRFDPSLPFISEIDAFLISELIKLLNENDNPQLIFRDQIAVVAARRAYALYLQFGFYICQPGRFFRNFSFIAFYEQQMIHCEIASIEVDPLDNVTLPQAIQQYSNSLGVNHNVVQRLIDYSNQLNPNNLAHVGDPIHLTQPFQYFPLTLNPADYLDNDIPRGVGGPVVYGQRYWDEENVRGVASNPNPGTMADL